MTVATAATEFRRTVQWGWIIAAVLMILWGRQSDRTGERVWHNAIPISAIVVGLLGTFFVSQLAPLVALLTLVLVGTYACKGPFWVAGL